MRSIVLLLAFTACSANWEGQDADGDGFTVAEGDCWDNPIGPAGTSLSGADIHPSTGDEDAETWYDGYDQDCDGASDFDKDHDGFDRLGFADGTDCWDDPDVVPAGFIAIDGFAQPTAEEVNPAATDAWYDGVQQDCGTDDDFDQDGDGHASDHYPDTTGAYGDDCDDLDPAVSPDANETWYDGVDQDCAGDDDYDQDGDGYPVDEECDDTDPELFPNDAVDEWYDGVDANCDNNDGDQDGDGYCPDDYAFDIGCTEGYGDCDDLAAGTNPGAEEIWYDGVDEDCAGDDDYDQDHDGHPSSDYGGDDCEDTDGSAYPGATETWYDGVDGDCDGHSDYDQDYDGYDSAAYGGDDCDDTLATVRPGVPEDCGTAYDDDCDGVTNEEDATACTTFYLDTDEDGYGTTDAACFCEAVAGGYSADNSEDCDDSSAAAYPGGTEVYYDGIDGDCLGGDDYDQDGDGEQSSDYSGTDCDDTDALVNTAAAEDCGTALTDDDCSGTTNDEDAVDCTTFYTDADGDGYGTAVSACYCEAIDDFTASNADDCDDSTAAAHPGGTETWYDGIDGDCDGASDYDQDGDGEDVDTTTGGTDCDDTDATVNTAAVEDCATTADDNCSSDDEDALSCTEWYADADGDGFGTGTSKCYCDATGSYSATEAGDCDDGDAGDNPDAIEDCASSDDDDCDTVTNEEDADNCTDYYVDGDGDGYGAGAAACWCAASGSYEVTDGTDCDDADPLDNPAGTETCNGDDEDCDGTADNDLDLYYADLDGDTYGDDATETCVVTTAYIGVGGDCDDDDDTVFPGATELCDMQQNDCDLTSWAESDEDNVVSYDDGSGVWTDASTTFNTGTAASPSTVALTSSGTWNFCPGDYYARLKWSGEAEVVLYAEYADRDGNGVTAINVNGRSGTALTVDGADVYVYGFTLTGGTGTSATYGGGVNLLDGSFVGASLELENCDLSDNQARYGGGASVRDGASLVLTNTTVTGNTATSSTGTAYGGGIYIEDASSVTCTGSSSNAAGVYDNTALTEGGGVYFLSNTGTFTSSACDWGTGATANSPDDVNGGHASFTVYDAVGDDQSFDCDAGTGGGCS